MEPFSTVTFAKAVLWAPRANVLPILSIPTLLVMLPVNPVLEPFRRSVPTPDLVSGADPSNTPV